MYSDNESLIKEAHRITSLLKKDFLLPNGALCLEKYGNEVFEHHIFPDLGDFLPFFLYFHEVDFIEKQIEIYRQTLQGGYLVSEFSSFHIPNLVKSYEYSDLLFGLYDYHTFKKDKISFDLLKSTSDLAINTFRFDRNIKSFFHSKFRKNLPLLDTRDGTFIEYYIDLFRLTKENKYKDVSYNIYKNLINTDYYKNHGLFAVYDVGIILKIIFFILGIKKHKIVVICKNNSNTLFGMLALYSETKDENVLASIDKVINGIKSKLIVDGGVSDFFVENQSNGVSTLTASFPIIDLLCDLYNETKNKEYISLAQNIADYWIGRQGKTGLFPLRSNMNESFFDSETDMCVALAKVFELTNDVKYKNSMDKCFNGIMEYHATNNYVLGVDINTGKVLNKSQRTKFIALFLKLLILKIRMNEGVNIYSDKILWNLLRDR